MSQLMLFSVYLVGILSTDHSTGRLWNYSLRSLPSLHLETCLFYSKTVMSILDLGQAVALPDGFVTFLFCA